MDPQNSNQNHNPIKKSNSMNQTTHKIQENSTSQYNKYYSVFLRAVTWQRDSHGLFDYESKNIQKKSLKTNSQGKIVRSNNDIELVHIDKEEKTISEDAQTLIQIKYSKEKGYYLDHSKTCDMQEEDSVDRLWLVIRSLKAPSGKYDYKIKKFDVIKLGRVKFRIKDFQCECMSQTPEELYQQELKEAKQVVKLDDVQSQTQESSEQITCRFCWGPDSTIENPLIVPCNCSGTLGFIHYQCLKNWLTSKMSKKENDCLTSLFWKTFECEICKQAYPYLFKVDKTIYKLVDIVKPTSGYFLVMESLPLEKNTSRTIHVLKFTDEKQQFQMGRGHESEVRVNDISVSRCHAIIKYKKDGIYIEDNRSKFGTLVLLKDTYQILLEYTSAVQIGRTVVSFTVRNTAVDNKQQNEQKIVLDNPQLQKQIVFEQQEKNVKNNKSINKEQKKNDDDDVQMEIDDN